MAYEFLKKLFKNKDENGNIVPMTYEELEAAIDGDKSIKLVDLSGGGYIAKEKYDAKDTELKGVKQQLADANEQINSFKDQDVDGIKQKVSEWETKYNTDTQELRTQLETQARTHAEELFMSGYKFTSKAAKKGIMDELRSKNFSIDNGNILGAKEFMESLMDDEDYKGAFVTENSTSGAEGKEGTGEESQDPTGVAGEGMNGAQSGQGRAPRFATGAKAGGEGTANPFNFNFNQIRKPEEK